MGSMSIAFTFIVLNMFWSRRIKNKSRRQEKWLPQTQACRGVWWHSFRKFSKSRRSDMPFRVFLASNFVIKNIIFNKRLDHKFYWKSFWITRGGNRWCLLIAITSSFFTFIYWAFRPSWFTEISIYSRLAWSRFSFARVYLIINNTLGIHIFFTLNATPHPELVDTKHHQRNFPKGRNRTLHNTFCCWKCISSVTWSIHANFPCEDTI